MSAGSSAAAHSGQDPPAGPGALAFARDLWRRAGRRGIAALALQLASSLSEGASVLLLVPVLGLVETQGDALVVRLPENGPGGALAGGATLDLPLVLAAVVALVALAAVLDRWRAIQTADLLAELVNGIRIDLARAAARARWAVFADLREADLTHVLTGDADRLQAGASAVLAVAQNAILILIYLAVSLAISPAMTLAAALAGGAMLLVLAPIRRRAHRLGARITRDRQAQYRIVSDFVHGMKAAKVHSGEMSRVEELDGTLERMRGDARAFIAFSSWGTAIIRVAQAAGLAAFVLVALTRAEIALAELVVLLFVFMRLAPRFLVVQSLVQQVLQCLPAIETVESFARRLDAAREEEPADGAAAPALAREMRAEDLWFGYGGAASAPALRGLSFTLPAGEVTAVTGPSGAGKSTLADILLGLLAPDRGRLVVDGQELTGATRRAWRSRTAFVPQDIVLSHDTILNNLRRAAPNASEAEARTALETAQAWSFVRDLPGGLHAVVGDRGARLSGGERQRIAIALALLRRPRLLVLDEATSALDWENQRAMAQALGRLKGEMTVVTIAHRPSMIAFADRVIVLENGTVAEAGRYDDLAADESSRLARMLAAEDT